ncbi:metal-dependent hydrolase [Burkholderia alba]|uniref:metal-dependent hydrolase n=1 Tax=Burkholderia alba TaxID=2683677 RepID=UPI002B0552BE|nr:metal-dependent hydrolase [Burkholderia alba]
MMPIRRDIRFALPPERACDWHVEGAPVTHFFNALSLLFPAGERFFMDSVRHYRDRIHDSELKKQVHGFIGQEAMHTREHVEYNDLLQSAGLPAHKLDARLWWILGMARKILPPSLQLAQTVALEHYTAMLADLLLADQGKRIEGSVDGYTQMWMWHALEETEHKAVSFDVWNLVVEPGVKRYLMRTGTMLLTTVLFWVIVFDFHVRLMIAHRRGRGKPGGMWRLLKFLYAPGGVFPGIALEWLRFFKPGFHPWDHDNRQHLARIDGLIAKIDQTNARYAAQAAPRRVPLHPAQQA